MEIIINNVINHTEITVSLIDEFNKALEKFSQKATSLWSCAKMNDKGVIIFNGFSNSTMLPTAILLFKLCHEYPSIFSFQFQESVKTVKKATTDSCKTVTPDGGLPRIGIWVRKNKILQAIDIINRCDIKN